MRNGMFKQLEDKTRVIDTTLKILKYNITLWSDILKQDCTQWNR